MVSLKKFDFYPVTAVTDENGDLGFVQFIRTDQFGDTVADVYFLETPQYPAGLYVMDPSRLKRHPICECGNPFRICHSEM